VNFSGNLLCYTRMSTAQNKKKLEDLVEQKMLEFFGDPDSGLSLKRGFAAALQKRLKKKQRLFSHAEVARKYGLR